MRCSAQREHLDVISQNSCPKAPEPRHFLELDAAQTSTSLPPSLREFPDIVPNFPNYLEAHTECLTKVISLNNCLLAAFPPSLKRIPLIYAGASEAVIHVYRWEWETCLTLHTFRLCFSCERVPSAAFIAAYLTLCWKDSTWFVLFVRQCCLTEAWGGLNCRVLLAVCCRCTCWACFYCEWHEKSEIC